MESSRATCRVRPGLNDYMAQERNASHHYHQLLQLSGSVHVAGAGGKTLLVLRFNWTVTRDLSKKLEWKGQH